METMQLRSKAAVHNFFEIEVRDAKTNELMQTARAENIVLNEYFRALANGYNSGSYESHNCIAIGIGRGTGTLSRTRTSLFNAITHRLATLINYTPGKPTASITREITLGVTEFNGEVITEVGFVSNFANTPLFSYSLVTHAFLQDSEGNPITITKTDTSIVIIRGTFFVTITPGTGLGPNGAYGAELTGYMYQNMCGVLSDNWRKYLLSRWPVTSVIELLRNENELTEAEWNTNRLPYIRRMTRTNTAEEASRKSSQTLWDAANMTITIPLGTFSDTAYTNQVFRCIGGVGGVINLPDHDFFPPFHVAGKNIGSGDGTTVDFNIGVPVIMPNTETIYVDAVPQTKGTDYLIEYDNNCVDMYENFFSCQYSVFSPNVEFGTAKAQSPTDSTSTFLRDPLLWSQDGSLQAGGKCKLPQNINITEANPAWFDFLEPKRCNLFKVVGPTVPAGQIANMVIQYSTDNTIWNNVPNLVRNAQVWTWDMTEARYWRIYIPSYTWVYPLSTGNGKTVNGLTYYATFFLGAQTPGLKFLTAPALNAVITADFDIDVIFKTTNNVLRFQWAIEVGFGEGS